MSPTSAPSTRRPARCANSTSSPPLIIGGASIFGGYGSVLGALAGAMVITLIRALLSLQIISSDGKSFVMPQHWVNVCIGLILIIAVLGDIWLRQERILARFMPADLPADAGSRRHDGQTKPPVVEMRGICKAFGAVQALQDVTLRLMPGEILGLVGDNSAGKSTLMKILSGAYQRDAGEVLVDGKPTHFRSPQESARPRHRDDLSGLRAVRKHGHRRQHVPGPLAEARACSSTARAWRPRRRWC